MTPRTAVEPGIGRVAIVRTAIIVALLIGWEMLARSGLLFRDVVPPLE